MQRRLKATLFFALGLSFLLTTILFAQSKQPVQRWEYFTLETCDGRELNKYGDEGWELVGVASRENNCPKYTLKRFKSADAPKYVDPDARPRPTADMPMCALTIAQAPKFRGIRLGMDVKELLSLFPGSEENPDVKKAFEIAKKPDGDQGLAYIGFTARQYQTAKETKELFADVSHYTFQIFDDRVVSFSVYLPEYKPDFNWQWTVSAWEKKLSETFNLPLSKEWGNSSKSHQGSSSLKCNGFFVSANVSGRFANFTVEEIATPTISDKVSKRREAAMEKIRQEFKLKP